MTRPGVHAVSEGLGLPLEKIGLITLDAHFDMRDTSQGLGNGNPVRALREDGLPGRNIAQIGLAPFANSAEMHRDAVDGGHLIVTIGDVRREGIAKAISAALVPCPSLRSDRGRLRHRRDRPRPVARSAGSAAGRNGEP